MRNYARLTLALLFGLIAALPHNTCAADASVRSSLFFAPEEVATIKNEAARKPDLFALDEKYKLTLQSIVYYTPNDWTIWLHNRAWTPATRDPNIHILKVTAQSVTLTATGANGRKTEPLTLHPHETLNLLTGEVLTGSLQPLEQRIRER